MSEAVLFSGNPYSYGAKTLEQIHRYLTRAVRGVCFATDEEQQAAQWLKEMQDKIKLLEDEVKLLYEKHKNSNNLHGIDEELYRQRIEYCLVLGVILSDGCLYAGLEAEPVLNDDYCLAIDRLMAH